MICVENRIKDHGIDRNAGTDHDPGNGCKRGIHCLFHTPAHIRNKPDDKIKIRNLLFKK